MDVRLIGVMAASISAIQSMRPRSIWLPGKDGMARALGFRPDDILPLQAADFVLHTMKVAWGGTVTASLTRLKKGCLARNIPFRQQIASTADMKAMLASRCP
jgi:hypothetical protein